MWRSEPDPINLNRRDSFIFFFFFPGIFTIYKYQRAWTNFAKAAYFSEWSWIGNPRRKILKWARLLYFICWGVNKDYIMTVKAQRLIIFHVKWKLLKMNRLWAEIRHTNWLLQPKGIQINPLNSYGKALQQPIKQWRRVLDHTSKSSTYIFMLISLCIGKKV